MIASLITLRGNYRSWGTLSAGNNRPTEMIPTASAILGLAASCIGLDTSKSGNIISWYNAFWVATCTATEFIDKDKPNKTFVPSVLTDFQTAQGNFGMDGKAKRTISYRDYITDAIDVAAIIPKNSIAEEWLERLQTAFEQPRSTPYLGRKSNPLSAPLTEIGERSVSIESFDDLAEKLARRLENECIGSWECSTYILRLPRNLFDSNEVDVERWLPLGEKIISDLRSSGLRFFSSRDVADYIGKNKRLGNG